MSLLSLVVPSHNEAESLPFLFDEINHVTQEMMQEHQDLAVEVVVVDDGSTDHTLDVLKQYSASQSQTQAPLLFSLRWISFSRNFGKEAALYAGLCNAHGDYVATMDADLQDPPSLLPTMYDILTTTDYDNVATYRTTRKGEPPIRSLFAKMFYKLINKLSKTKIVDGARDYRMMNRTMVNAILKMGEFNRFSKGIYGWVGFKTKWLPFENVERVAGKSNWNFFSLFSYSLEGILAFSTKPLSIASISGIVMCLVAFIALIVIIVKTLLFGDPVSGWPSLACLILFVGGLQLLCLGIIGKYLAKTYLETKDRPLYLIRETNLEDPVQ